MDALSCLIFGLTPRAGPKHHVLILPEPMPPGGKDTIMDKVGQIESRLSELQEKRLEEGVVERDFIIVGNIVEQRTTGRKGREWLCLYCPELGQLDKENVVKWLQEKFACFQERISNHDWQCVKGEVDYWPDLGEWLREAQNKFFSSGVTLEPDKAKRSVLGSMRWRYAMLAMAMGGLVAAAVVVDGRAANVFKPFIETMEKICHRPEPPHGLGGLAEILGLDRRAPLEAIADKLEEAITPANGSKTLDPDARIRKVLLLIDYEVNRPVSQRESVSVEDLVKYHTILDAVEKLFPQGKGFDSLGIIRTDASRDLLAWAKGLDYQELARFVGALSKLNDIGTEEQEEITRYFQRYPPQGIDGESLNELGRLFQLASHPKLREFDRQKSPRRFLIGEDIEVLKIARESASVVQKLAGAGDAGSWKQFQEAMRLDRNNVLRALASESHIRAERAGEPKLKKAWSQFGQFIEQLSLRGDAEGWRSVSDGQSPRGLSQPHEPFDQRAHPWQHP